MYKIGLVDDEHHARETLKAMLMRIDSSLEIVFEAQSPEEAIQKLGENKIDILFLDIHLKGGSGFQVLERIPGRDFHVIFVTAYNQYAMDAFRFAALHYILKPLSMNDLVESLQRVSKAGAISEVSEQWSVLNTNMKENEPRLKKICIPHGNEMVFLKLSDVIRLEASSNYTWFYLSDAKYLVSRTMKEYEDLLCRHGFIRVHQSHIINPDFISKYIKSGGGEIVMTDESVVPLARNRKSEFMKFLKF
ncbi:MAG: hypothetical protein CVU05_13385 [Bacteroidetes bacterium HGW-Bacteroidetes-21]|jgi:two-component system LytT family response regulator|nr:MAG: hypothetical protein CVU05_13385 [Bacteroidetes bacterium HGW-Bacteroidetes-21]